jgi:hypothetical protein
MTKETDKIDGNDDNIFEEEDSGMFDEFVDENAISEDDFLTDDDDDDSMIFEDDDDLFDGSNDDKEDDIFNSSNDDNDLFKDQEKSEVDDADSDNDSDTDLFKDDDEDEDDIFKTEEDKSDLEDKVKDNITSKTIENKNPEHIEKTAKKSLFSSGENDKRKNRPEKFENVKDSVAKSVMISVVISSVISISGSYALLYKNNNDLEIKNVMENSEKNSSSLLSMENRVLNSIESTKNVNYEIDILSKKIEKIAELEKQSDTLKKYISLTFKKARKNENEYTSLNKKINDLPNSTIQISQKIVELEAKLLKLKDYDEYKTMLNGVKKAIRTQQNDIASIKKKVKINQANANKSKVAYEDINNKALQNAQKITQNIKGIRNVNQKVMGESSVKDLLKRSLSESKDVRTVSLLFDNNKTVQIDNNNNIGYNIVGSIESEIFYIEDEKNGLIIYEIGDNLEGYGLIKEIKSNRVIITERGIVRNTNKDDL